MAQLGKHKHIRRSVICLLILLVLILSVSFLSSKTKTALLQDKMQFIIHGGGLLSEVDASGELHDYIGSNSLEGLQQCIEAGYEVIELDFNFTADGQLVCIHHWGSEFAPEFTSDAPATMEEFLSVQIYGNYTPVNFEMLINFLEEHPEIYIVTDIKDDNLAGVSYIAEHAPQLKDRFIVQIYNENEYDPVQELGFPHIIFTLYALDWNAKTDCEALAQFAQTHPLVGYTFSYELCAVDGFVEGMLKTGVPLFVHTVNDEAQQQKYFDMGFTGIYTDIVK